MTRVGDPGDDRERGVLESLADGDCRSILKATHRPRTAPEISDLCEIPLSTVYRKVDRLTDLSLLETRVRIDSDGRHPTQYERRIDGLLIQLGPRDDLNVSVYRSTEPGGGGEAVERRLASPPGEGGSGDGGSATGNADAGGEDGDGGDDTRMPVEIQFVDAGDGAGPSDGESAAEDGA